MPFEPQLESVSRSRITRRFRPGMYGAILVAFLLHVVVLVSILSRSRVDLALQNAGRPATGAGVQVTLVSEPSAPVHPVSPPQPPHPQPKPAAHLPKPRRSVPVLASHTSTAADAVTAEEAARPVPVSAEQSAAPSRLPPQPQTMPAAISPEMNLPGSHAVKNVKNVACRIPQPNYPSRARRLEQEGDVKLLVTISTSGQVSEAKIVNSSGIPDLDASAQEAMLAGRCAPYIDGGQAISVTALQTVSFRLNP